MARRFLPHPITLLALLTAVAAVGHLLWRAGAPHGPAAGPLTTFQDADVPLPMPADGKPDFRLHQFDAWQLAGMPTATRFDAPLGSEHGALTYDAQPFWAMNETRGGHHTGDDLNGIGGMNSDLGDPVFAVADGVVVYAGQPSPGWGKVLIAAHRLPDGRLLQSMYAHLDRCDAHCGQWVARGQRVGSVGTANGYYPAHLHFELRESPGVDIGGGYGEEPLNRLPPAATLRDLAGAAEDALAPSPLAVVLQSPAPH